LKDFGSSFELVLEEQGGVEEWKIGLMECSFPELPSIALGIHGVVSVTLAPNIDAPFFPGLW
jgi:hypothetical protein